MCLFRFDYTTKVQHNSPEDNDKKSRLLNNVFEGGTDFVKNFYLKTLVIK